MATTTNTYKCYPSGAAGISRDSSGGVAWSDSAWTELVPASTITVQYNIAAICCMYSNNPALDTTVEVELQLGTGGSGSEVVIATIPWTLRIDTAVGHHAIPWFLLPEPKEVAANTRLAVRVRQSLATTVVTYNGIKIMYHST